MQKKSFIVSELLCFFFGWLGIHRYYTGYIGIGIAQTLTLGGLGIWAIIDFISISLNKYRDAEGNELEGYKPAVGTAFLIVWVLLFFSRCNSFKNGITVTSGENTGGIKSSTYSTSSDNINIGKIIVDDDGKKHQTIKFQKATCTIYVKGKSQGHSCIGSLSKSDEFKLKEIKRELALN